MELVIDKVTCAQENAQEENNGVETRKGTMFLCIVSVLLRKIKNVC
jgi:hypothetical protein